MCSSPITIPNPYYKLGNKGLNFLHDTVNTHIQVPCGQCHQCCSLRQAYFNQRIQMESLRSHLFMITLTYKDSALCYTGIGEYNIPYPEYSDISLMMKRIRKRLDHPIRVCFASEYGVKRKRPHYHGIIAVSKDDVDLYYKSSPSLCEQKLSQLFLSEWRRNIGSRRKPNYINLCDYVVFRGRRTFDLHLIQPIVNHDNDVSFYVSKYVLKYDSRISKLLTKIDLDNSLTAEDVSLLRSKIKPRLVCSKDFGSPDFPAIRDYITRCIEKNESELPQFYDLYTGQTSLLSRYYRKHCYKTKHALSRFYLSDSPNLYSSHVDSDLSIYDYFLNANSAFRESEHFRSIKNHLEGYDNWI